MQSLIFDLDETLIDRTETMRLFLTNQYLRFANFIKATKEDYIKSVLHHQKNGYENKHTAYKLACAQLIINEQIADDLFTDFKDKYGYEAILFTGVKEVLERLSKNFTLGLVTNGRAKCQNAKIDFVGIRPFFKSIKISESFGVKKPDQRIFESCLAELGCDPSNCVCIGDNPINDLLPAKDIGMKTIWVMNDNFDASDTYDEAIESVKFIEAALKKLTP